MEGVDCASCVKILLSGVRKRCLRLNRFKSGKALAVFSPGREENFPGNMVLLVWSIFVFYL